MDKKKKEKSWLDRIRDWEKGKYDKSKVDKDDKNKIWSQRFKDGGIAYKAKCAALKKLKNKK